MAGTDRRFDADRFRDAMHFVAEMAKPDTEEQQVVFHWNIQRTFEIADPAGQPWDYSTPATDVHHQAEMQVPVLVEHSPRALASGTSRLGDFGSDLVKLTLIDEDYETISDQNGRRLPDYVTIDGDRYNIDKEAPPDGLFDVTMHTLICVAQDES